MSGRVLAEETLVVPATADQLAAIHAALDRFWDAVDCSVSPPPAREWRLRFATAALELATNVVRHAYPDGMAGGPLQLRLRAYPDRVVARFADDGMPFAGSLEPRGAFDLDPLDLPEGGFGLGLILACVDRLGYRRTPGGMNCWRLVKRY